MSTRLALPLCFLPLCLLLLISLTSPAAVFGQDAQRPLSVDDLFELGTVGAPEISPDGLRVAYTVSRLDAEKDKSETAIWMVATASEAPPIRMTSPGTSGTAPAFAPDGSKLLFLAARGDEEDSKTQVWAFDLRGGDAQPLTTDDQIQQGVDGFVISPDGKRLLLTLTDPDPKDLLEEHDPKKERPSPAVIDRLQFKQDYSGYLNRLRSHLYVFDLSTRELRQITSGDYDDSEAVWSQDGKKVAFTSNRTAEPDGNLNTDIWLVSADNTDQGKTLRQLTSNPGADSSPAFSLDGKTIAYVTVTEPDLIWYALNKLAVVSVETGESRVLTEALDRNVSAPRFSTEGDLIWCKIEDSGEDHLALIHRSSGKIERVLDDSHALPGSFSVSNGDTVALLLSRPDLPQEVFLVESEPGEREARQLTFTNRDLLASLALGSTENIHFKSPDGTEIEGFVTLPPDYQAGFKYPTLLRIHGGPVGQYDASFSFEAQLFAGHGYVVVRSNPRGSSGYGRDFSYALFADWGNKDTQDVVAAVDHAIERGWSDPERLGVGGWSYGGILTNYVITQTDRFEGAITGASEVLYVSNYGHDHYQFYWEKELGLPWGETRQNWERISPFNKVENITTPTLIMGGSLDWNVPILNSEQLYQALKRLGRTTQLVVYPGEHHGIARPSFQKDRYERYLAWYDQYVKGEAAAEVADK